MHASNQTELNQQLDDAIVDVLNRYQYLLRSLLWHSKTLDREDGMQDIAMKITRYAYKEPVRFRAILGNPRQEIPWLRTVVKNRTVDAARDLKRRVPTEQLEDWQVHIITDDDPSPEGQAIAAQIRSRAHRIMDEVARTVTCESETSSARANYRRRLLSKFILEMRKFCPAITPAELRPVLEELSQRLKQVR